MSSAELIELNKLKNPDKLEVGQVLHVFGLLDLEASLERGKRPAASVRLPNPKSLGLKLSEPIEKLKLSSGFGPRGSSFHEGLDFVAPEGTPIFSAHTGEVIYSGWGMSGFGNLIAIRGNGFFSLYAHNSKNLVYKGDVIERGQQIALVGSTGRATAAHLHFELRVRGSDGRFYAVDPKPLF
jgi:murein DD-endopeptidase MepM/ murein hydrolase activator NlpD